MIRLEKLRKRQSPSVVAAFVYANLVKRVKDTARNTKGRDGCGVKRLRIRRSYEMPMEIQYPSSDDE